MNKDAIRKITAYLVLATVILFIITGYGITQYRIVERITFGVLTKALSFQIHSYLIYPLLIFLIIHLMYACDLLKWLRKRKNTGKKS